MSRFSLIPHLSLRSRVARAKVGISRARTYVGTKSLTIHDRIILRKAKAASSINEPRTAEGKAIVRKLQSAGFLKQVDVFPSRYVITASGEQALSRSLEQKSIRGVSTVITPGEAKALKLIGSKELAPPFNKQETSIVIKLLRRKLITKSVKGIYSVTKVGKAVIAEQ